METFPWDDSLRLGVPEVDEQHKQWFALTNAYLDLVKRDQGNIKVLQDALKASVAYSRSHFRTEEAMMRRIRFPQDEYNFHCMTHDAFVERLNALAKHGRERRPAAVREMAVFMSGWLTKHIREVDIKYVGFYLSKSGWGSGKPVKTLSPQIVRLRQRFVAQKKKPG
jgi:hemerythrin